MVINGEDLRSKRPILGMYSGKQVINGVTHGMSEAGYDVRVKQEICFTRDLFLRRAVRVVTYNEFGESSEEIEKGKFTIASTIERFSMPTTLVGIVHDKSSWARRGLSVFNTVIEPGWEGHLTLELVYHGWRDLFIPAGSGIAQVVFHEVSEPCRYQGRYQNQPNRPVPTMLAVE